MSTRNQFHFIALMLSTQIARGASIYTSGHGDLGVSYVAGQLQQHYHLDEDAVVDGFAPATDKYAPESLITFVSGPPNLRPADSPWDFIGASPGDPVWFLPQAEDPIKPFLGLASEELIASQWSSLTVSLAALNGPTNGHFSLYQTDGFGSPIVRLASSDGITAADSFPLTVGGHSHYNWTFTQPGVFALSLTFAGVHTSDGPKSATATYTFGVTQVPEPTTALLALAAVSLLARRTRARD